MLYGNLAIAPHDAALEQRPKILNRVGVNVAPYVFECYVVHGVTLLRDVLVRGLLIGVETVASGATRSFTTPTSSCLLGVGRSLALGDGGPSH